MMVQQEALYVQENDMWSDEEMDEQLIVLAIQGYSYVVKLDPPSIAWICRELNSTILLCLLMDQNRTHGHRSRIASRALFPSPALHMLDRHPIKIQRPVDTSNGAHKRQSQSSESALVRPDERIEA